MNVLGHLDTDNFPSAVNNKLEKYVLWKADPKVLRCGAFTMSWDGFNIYAFSPFILTADVIHIISQHKMTEILVFPRWLI